MQHQVIPVAIGGAVKLCTHTKQLVLVSIQARYVCWHGIGGGNLMRIAALIAGAKCCFPVGL